MKPNQRRWVLIGAGTGSLLLLGSWLFPIHSGARSVLAFLPPAGFGPTKHSESADNGSVPSWSSPCELSISLLNGAGLQTSLCRQLENLPDDLRGPGLKKVYGMLEDRKIRASALSENLLEIRVEQRDLPLALTLCQATITFLQQALRDEYVNQAESAQLKSDVQAAEDSLLAEEQKLSQSWFADAARLRGREVAVQFALNHYREALINKGAAETRLARRTFRLEENAPVFAVVVPPQSYTYWHTR